MPCHLLIIPIQTYYYQSITVTLNAEVLPQNAWYCWLTRTSQQPGVLPVYPSYQNDEDRLAMSVNPGTTLYPAHDWD